MLRTLRILKDLLPGSHVILMALLPRGGTGGGDLYYRWPSVFTQPFDVVNAHFMWVPPAAVCKRFAAGACLPAWLHSFHDALLQLHTPQLACPAAPQLA